MKHHVKCNSSAARGKGASESFNTHVSLPAQVASLRHFRVEEALMWVYPQGIALNTGQLLCNHRI